jgi:hypothetical protein
MMISPWPFERSEERARKDGENAVSDSSRTP